VSWFPQGPKPPPPKRGIKMKKAGTTWWGARWIEALEEVLGGESGRLARGRTYARAGRTHDLVIASGRVHAKVTGSRPQPYLISIHLGALSAEAWKGAIAQMAARAQFAADLLDGRMPEQIDEVFRAVGASLFPATRDDCVTECSCPDWGEPCKHVAATHYVLGEALDRDPFLLFELRGKAKADVLDALRAARGGRRSAPASPEIPTVSLRDVAAADYDRPREPLPHLRFSFEAPSHEGALLRQLGAPPGWDGADSPADALAPLVKHAADEARRLATAEPAPEPPPGKSRRRRAP
jgi:uncharacterized Zn finger protein